MNTSSHQSTRAAVLLAAVLLCAGSGIAKTDDSITVTAEDMNTAAAGADQAKVAARLGDKFKAFAGSTANADALVSGLQAGTSITLTNTVNGQEVTTTFQPATGKLGYGNAFIALSLAEKSLAQAGITSPTAAQIEAALNGGTVTGSSGQSVTLTGVLAMRASGKGWGDVARSLDVKLGPVVSDMRAEQAKLNAHAALAADTGGKMRGQSGALAAIEAANQAAARTSPPAWAGSPVNAGVGADAAVNGLANRGGHH